ncbi:MAG: hypothetical protein JW934_07445, partial [Anaerolineae bacterium]|nr:hypothetical protein [Anaerolineae bacterium]
GPSGLTGKPEQAEGFVHLIDAARPEQPIDIYVSCEIWDALAPDDDKLLVSIEGYGRFWIKLERTSVK